MLQAAINGARALGEHAALPVTPAEQARAAAACRRQGAEAIHARVRGSDGRETLGAEAVGKLILALGEGVPGLPVGVSTGAWIVPDPVARLAEIRARRGWLPGRDDLPRPWWFWGNRRAGCLRNGTDEGTALPYRALAAAMVWVGLFTDWTFGRR